jgi:Putative beta barrel porin-7 (BBP7)
MTAYRVWMSLGVLCMSGTALAQSNYFDSANPYGIRLARLDAPAQPQYSYASPTVGMQPVVAAPVNSIRAPESVPAQPSVPSNETAGMSSDWSDNAVSQCGGNVCGNSCGCDCSPYCDCCNDHWYAYMGGLTMGRTTANKTYTTFDQTNQAHQLLYFPPSDWGGGIDMRIGYWFGCGCCGDPCSCGSSCGSSGRAGIEVAYWGVWGMNGVSSITDAGVGPNQLGTVFNEGFVGFLNPDDASIWFDNASAVKLLRSDEVNNVEVNFLYMPCCDSCNRFQMTALAGFRYFQFRDNLEWDQFAGTGLPGGDPGEAITVANVSNNLFGFQIGTYMNFQICNRWSIFAVPKVGIYGNHIAGFNSMFLSDGTPARFDANGDALNFNNSTNVFSVLGQIDVGFNWWFSRNWSFVGGYRVVAASGVALADNQIPQFFADEAGWKTIKTNGDLVLDGAFAGLECRF